MGIFADQCVQATAEGGILAGYEIITSVDVIDNSFGGDSKKWYENNTKLISIKSLVK